MKKTEINTAKKAKIDEETVKEKVFLFFFFYGVLPSILSVDIGAIVDQALRDFDPAVERRHVERCAVVVVPSVHQRPIFLQKLPDCSGVVLVRVPENRRGPAHSRFLLLLLLLLQRRRHWRGASAANAADFAAGAVSAGGRVGAH